MSNRATKGGTPGRGTVSQGSKRNNSSLSNNKMEAQDEENEKGKSLIILNYHLYTYTDHRLTKQ